MTRKRTTSKKATPTKAKGGKRAKASKAPKANGGKATPASRRPDIAPRRRERGEKALKMRKAGKSWAQIGEAMSISASYARNCAADVAGGNDNLPKI